MQINSASPTKLLSSVWRNRALIFHLAKRDVVGRYKGSILGIFWSLINPVFMLIVYTFVFSIIFKARWQSQDESRTVFALVLFSGLLVFNLFSECVVRAPGLILGNVNYVKKVIFPLEILPWVSLAGAIFHFSVSFVVWLLAYSLTIGLPHYTVLVLPLIILPFIFFVMGVSWALSSLGVFLRDVGQLVGMLVTILMFLSPIFFPVTAIPEKYQFLVFLNPLTYPIEMVRDVMFWGRLPNLLEWVIYLVVSLVVSMLGFAWFQKTRKGFADVL